MRYKDYKKNKPNLHSKIWQAKAEVTPRNHTKPRLTEHLTGKQVLMVKTAPWLKDLRGTIKRTYGAGWALEERSGCFKIQRREAGNAREGKRPTITTKIRFAPSSSTEVLVLIGELKRKMADLGLGLYVAHSLISGAADRRWDTSERSNRLCRRNMGCLLYTSPSPRDTG